MEGQEAPEAIKAFIDEHRPHFSWLPEVKKVKCELNGHEFAPRLDQLNIFARGKKFHQMKVKKAGMAVVEHNGAFIGPSKNFSDKMYCKLTGALIACDANMAIKHMEGKKFKKRKVKLDADPDNFQFTEEPNLSDVERQIREEASDGSVELFTPINPLMVEAGMSNGKSEQDDMEEEVAEERSQRRRSGRKGKRGKSKGIMQGEDGAEDVMMEDDLMADIQSAIVKMKETGFKRKTKKSAKTRGVKAARNE